MYSMKTENSSLREFSLTKRSLTSQSSISLNLNSVIPDVDGTSLPLDAHLSIRLGVDISRVSGTVILSVMVITVPDCDLARAEASSR